MVNNSNIEKLTEPFFQENSFLPKFGQKGPRMAPKYFFVNFLKNFIMLVFLGNNIEKMRTNIVIDKDIWQDFRSRVMDQNAASQSNCRIL